MTEKPFSEVNKLRYSEKNVLAFLLAHSISSSVPMLDSLSPSGSIIPVSVICLCNFIVIHRMDEAFSQQKKKMHIQKKKQAENENETSEINVVFGRGGRGRFS